MCVCVQVYRGVCGGGGECVYRCTEVCAVVCVWNKPKLAVGR